MKKKFEIEREIKEHREKIICLQRSIYSSKYSFQKLYYNELLKKEIRKLRKLTNDLNKDNN